MKYIAAIVFGVLSNDIALSFFHFNKDLSCAFGWTIAVLFLLLYNPVRELYYNILVNNKTTKKLKKEIAALKEENTQLKKMQSQQKINFFEQS